MGIQFNIDEVFAVAEQIERNGAEFYRKAAEGTADESEQKTLLDLAVMEDDHLQAFAAMRSETAEQYTEPSIFDPDGEVELYLHALAQGHVFDVKVPPAERLGGLKSMKDILRFAIGIEKDSIVYYTGMRDLVPRRLGKDKMDTIIREEMSHITTLSNELAALD